MICTITALVVAIAALVAGVLFALREWQIVRLLNALSDKDEYDVNHTIRHH